ncbi:MAG: beta-ketoacyl synthase N-terminal-like domain-containing protein [Planctomycetaceae bacterium]
MGKQPRLSRGVALVAAGMSDFGVWPGKDSKDLFLEAFADLRDSADGELDPGEIEAAYIGNFTNDVFVGQSHWGAILADALGIVPAPVTRTEGACASSGIAFREACFAIGSGFYDVVLVGGVEDMSKRSTAEVAEGLALAATPDERRAGLTFPGVFGAIASAYFDRYGATREHLAAVTIKSHLNAADNPRAQLGRSIREMMISKARRAEQQGRPVPEWKDERDFLGDDAVNPVVAEPLHLFDCCPISDGAACLLLVAEERASQFNGSPLFVAGIGQGSGRGLQAAEELTSFEATRAAATEAYAMTGVNASDIQLAEVHDCFSIAEILHLEDLGFFEAGQGAVASLEGRTQRDGEIPVNTSGGLKCKGHPVGATGAAQIVELWLQLRQQAGPRQVGGNDLRLGLAHNLGGTGGTSTVTILERRD